LISNKITFDQAFLCLNTVTSFLFQKKTIFPLDETTDVYKILTKLVGIIRVTCQRLERNEGIKSDEYILTKYEAIAILQKITVDDLTNKNSIHDNTTPKK
jgi:hypothetical protein